MAKVCTVGLRGKNCAEIVTIKTEWNAFLSVPQDDQSGRATLIRARKLLGWSDELLRVGQPTGDVMSYSSDNGSGCRAFAEVDALYELFEVEDGLRRPAKSGWS